MGRQVKVNRKGESRSIKKKQEIAQSPQMQLKDNRAEASLQRELSSSLNSGVGNQAIQQMTRQKNSDLDQKSVEESEDRVSHDTPVVQGVFEAWVIELAMESSAEIAEAMRHPKGNNTAWHVMLEYLNRWGIEKPDAEDVRGLMQQIFQRSPAPDQDNDQGDGSQRMTDDQATIIAKENGWVAVDAQLGMDKFQSEAGKKHAPKGRVFTDGNKNFWGADNTMHAKGACWKYWTGSANRLVYKGNVTNEHPTSPVERGAQRTMTKKEKNSKNSNND